jgi:hypothetical protein
VVTKVFWRGGSALPDGCKIVVGAASGDLVAVSPQRVYVSAWPIAERDGALPEGGKA